jgi:hypothetical protein
MAMSSAYPPKITSFVDPVRMAWLTWFHILFWLAREEDRLFEDVIYKYKQKEKERVRRQ